MHTVLVVGVVAYAALAYAVGALVMACWLAAGSVWGIRFSGFQWVIMIGLWPVFLPAMLGVLLFGGK